MRLIYYYLKIYAWFFTVIWFISCFLDWFGLILLITWFPVFWFIIEKVKIQKNGKVVIK